MIASVPLMKRLAEEIYRKLRNTFRFLLANLDGFVPQSDAVAWEEMEALDQYMLARCAEVVTKVRGAYEAFEFHRAYHALNEFCNAELSAFYLDVLKDRLYTLAPKDTRRLSAQTAVWKIAEALVRLIAPVLSFTADEVWGYLPHVDGREASVHIAQFPAENELASDAEAKQLREEFGRLRTVRESAMKLLEAARASKAIGKALDAKIVLRVPDAPVAPLLSKYERILPELFGVSQVELQAIDPALGSTALEAEFAKADGDRCERCWRYTMDVGAEGMFPTVCARCADALEKIGFPPYSSAQEAA